MRQADASDICESTPVITSPAATLQPGRKPTAPLRMTRTIQFRRPNSGSRPSSELSIRQADAPD
eukprot:5902228-Pyramimonas_sp.AAC.1